MVKADQSESNRAGSQVDREEEYNQIEREDEEDQIERDREKNRVERVKLKKFKIDDLNRIQLDAHNEYRANHGVPPVRWCPDLAKQAQDWADQLVADLEITHSNKRERSGQGENIVMYCATGPDDKTLTMTAFATNSWYSEGKCYDFDRPGCVKQSNKRRKGYKTRAGYFSQLVWKGTTKVGFGTAGNFVVARYGPAGNVKGEFENNVFPINESRALTTGRTETDTELLY